jgi:hypothetical protein
MAAPTDINDSPSKPEARDDVRQQLNNLIAGIRALCTKLDADTLVNNTNYFALIADAAATSNTPPAKVL